MRAFLLQLASLGILALLSAQFVKAQALIPDQSLPSGSESVTDKPYVEMVPEELSLAGPTMIPQYMPGELIMAGVDADMVAYRDELMLRSDAMLPAPTEANDLFYLQL